MERKIIWSLFDSETAITQQLNSDVYKVYSIGLASEHSVTDSFISIDLSRKSCIRKLNKLPRPDIIFASPPCESWVTVNRGLLQYFPRNHREYNKNFIFHANYCERSTVPLGVYKDILRQIERPRTLNLELK